MKVEDRDIDPQIIRDYYAWMMVLYDAKYVRKDSDPIMEIARQALCLVGIDAGKHWMDYATTDAFGRKVYIPFEPGDRSSAWSPWEQIAVLAHECQHLHQADEAGVGGTIAEAIGYALDTSERTAHEAEAYVTSAELHYWRYGVLEDWWIENRANALKSYGVSDRDVEHIHAHLRSAAETIRRGGVISHAGSSAIDWLNRNAPELRGSTSPSAR